MPTKILRAAFREMWIAESPRAQTLARLVHHERQIEAWWRCELAAHLWDYATKFDKHACVWMETPKRADIAIARGETNRKGAFVPVIADEHLVIPIELKTVGTFWGAGSGIDKAYRESGKKRLEHDMIDARTGRRPSRPFSVVALLVTHAGKRTDPVFQQYLRRARELGDQHALVRALDATIPLPPVPDGPSAAHQLVWTSPAVSPRT